MPRSSKKKTDQSVAEAPATVDATATPVSYPCSKCGIAMVVKAEDGTVTCTYCGADLTGDPNY